MEAYDNMEAYVVHTGKRPLSMYDPPLWAMCFPDCFPYGDGVFGLPRETPLTFQQWTRLVFLREELEYSIDEKAFEEARLFVPTMRRSLRSVHEADDTALAENRTHLRRVRFLSPDGPDPRGESTRPSPGLQA